MMILVIFISLFHRAFDIIDCYLVQVNCEILSLFVIWVFQIKPDDSDSSDYENSDEKLKSGMLLFIQQKELIKAQSRILIASGL